MDTPLLPIKFVPKGWGFEKWIVNCEEYCGKLLYLVKTRVVHGIITSLKTRSSMYSPGRF